MSSFFSYEVLKNIIENLDLEKRIQISHSCPSLNTAERKSLLHLDYLRINQYYFTVNNLELGVYEIDNVSYLTVHRKVEGARVTPRIVSVKPDEMLKKLVDLYLEDRMCIKVDVLHCDYAIDQLSKFPKDLKIECRELKLAFRQVETIQTLLPFLKTTLEKLSISFDENDDFDLLFDQELVKNAKLLVVRKDNYWTDQAVELLSQLKNRNVHLEIGSEPEIVMKVAESWLARCPKVGTRFTVDVERYEYVLDVMDAMINDKGAVRGEVLEEGLRNSALRHCATIQMRSGDELNIFGGVNMEKNKNRRAIWLLRMEVMKKGSSKLKRFIE